MCEGRGLMEKDFDAKGAPRTSFEESPASLLLFPLATTADWVTVERLALVHSREALPLAGMALPLLEEDGFVDDEEEPLSSARWSIAYHCGLGVPMRSATRLDELERRINKND